MKMEKEKLIRTISACDQMLYTPVDKGGRPLYTKAQIFTLVPARIIEMIKEQLQKP